MENRLFLPTTVHAKLAQLLNQDVADEIAEKFFYEGLPKFQEKKLVDRISKDPQYIYYYKMLQNSESPDFSVFKYNADDFMRVFAFAAYHHKGTSYFNENQMEVLKETLTPLFNLFNDTKYGLHVENMERVYEKIEQFLLTHR